MLWLLLPLAHASVAPWWSRKGTVSSQDLALEEDIPLENLYTMYEIAHRQCGIYIYIG